MKKLYDLCRKYGIEIRMTYDAYYAYGDSVLFKFYDRKTNKYFAQIVTDEMINAPNISFEDVLYDRVIRELKLDKNLCERCNGSGVISDYNPDHRSVEYSVCPICNGHGMIFRE